VSEGVVEGLRRVLETPEDADDVLRDTVRLLVEEPGIVWAAIAFVEADALVVGPEAGAPEPTRRTVVPIAYESTMVGELRVDGEVERSLLEHVAQLVAAHVLLGWDTCGVAWSP
jgi:hypothetical protein